MGPFRSIFCIVCCFSLAACGAAPPDRESQGGKAAPATPVNRIASSHDWTRFGWDLGRSSVSADPTGISASNVATLRRPQASLDGAVDGSAIYLHGVRANGGTHDVSFVTTTYGKTLAIDAGDGTILWRFTPSGYDSWVGSRQITTATPVADPGREFIYAASPDGRIQKLAVADGHAVWSTAITKLPGREKIASSLNFFRGRGVAVTGGGTRGPPPGQRHAPRLWAARGGALRALRLRC